MKKYIIGSMIRQEEMQVAVFTYEGALMQSWSIPFWRGKGCKEVLGILWNSLDKILKSVDIHESEISGIGISVPGEVEKNGRIINYCPELGWGIVNIQQIWGQFSNLPVTAGSHRNMLLLGECLVSKEEFRNAAGFWMERELQGALLIEGRFLWGREKAASDFCEMPASWSRSEREQEWKSLKEMVSGIQIEEEFRKQTRLYAGLQKSLAQKGTLQEIFKLAENGEPVASKILDEVAMSMARSVVCLTSILPLEAVFVCGELVKENPCMADKISKFCQEMGGKEQVRIIGGKLGNEAALYGSARYVREMTGCKK